MKVYKRKLLALSVIFALGAFMLIFVAVGSDKNDTALDYGLPKEYRLISVYRMDIAVSSKDLSHRIIDVIKEDEDVIAIFSSGSTDHIYLFDPSGYYFNKQIKGEYFSREDFLRSDGSPILIYENSAYSLMEDGGSVYALDRERRVIGAYSKEHPLYEYSNGANIVSDFSFDNEISGTLYLANCSAELVTDVKKAFVDESWDVNEDRRTYPKDYSGLVLPGENHLIPAGMLALFVFAMLLYLTHAESMNKISLGRGMGKYLFPIAAGCLGGCAIGMVIAAAFTHKTMWNICGIALVASFGIMLVLEALSWIISTGLGRRMGYSKGNGLLEILLGKVAAIFLMVAVFFSSSYMQGVVYPLIRSLKALPYGRSIEAYDIVSFSGSYKDNAGEDLGYSDKICKAALSAIKDGQAYSVVFDGSIDRKGTNYEMVLGPLMQMNGLEEPKYQYSCYLSRVGASAAGDTIEAVNVLDHNVPGITATVQTLLPDGVYPRVGTERTTYGNAFSSYIAMSVDDYQSSGRSMSLVPNGLCFINPTKEQMEEYMGMLVEEGFHVNVERWNGRAEGETGVNFLYVLARGIVALAIVLEVLLWAVEAVRLYLIRKKEEYKVLELYGAGLRVIERNAFLLSAAIVLPGTLLSAAVLPIQGWRYLGIEYVQVKLFYMPSLEGLIGFLAVGIVFALTVTFIGCRGRFSTNSRIMRLRKGM